MGTKIKHRNQSAGTTAIVLGYNRIFTAIALFSMIAAIYSLFYSGTFLTDDEHILASRSLSLAFDDSVNIGRVIGNSRVYNLSQLPVRQANEAANVEPAQAVLGALLAKASVLMGVGRIQVLFLLNIWITAFTGIIVYFMAVTMKYSQRIALILTGFFSLGTIAFPYSRTFFRDSLAMMFLAGAWLFAHQIIRQAEEPAAIWKHSLSWLGLTGFSIAGILSKNTVVIAIPVILLEMLLRYPGRKKLTFSASLWKKLGMGLGGISIIGLTWYLVIPNIPLLARFTLDYYISLIKFFLTTPRPNFLQALLGPFVSPGKSIFLFSPVLFLSFLGLIYHFRSNWAAWLYLLLLVVFQALFYDADWSGHVNWGLRYVLPALPMLVVAAAPLVERLIRKRQGQLALAMIGAGSLAIQLLGVLTPVRQYFTEKFTAVTPISEQMTIWQAKQSILLWSAKWVLAGKSLDQAVLRNPGSFLLIIFVIVIFGLLTIYYFRYRKLQSISFFSVTLLIVLNVGMMFLYKDDPVYSRTRNDLVQSQVFLNENVDPQDLVFIKSYGTPAWYYWMNWNEGNIPWMALPYSFPDPLKIGKFNLSQRPEDALDPMTLAIFNEEVKPGMKVWILNPGDSPGADLRLEMMWMAARAKDSNCKNFINGEMITKVCWYIMSG